MLSNENFICKAIGILIITITVRYTSGAAVPQSIWTGAPLV